MQARRQNHRPQEQDQMDTASILSEETTGARVLLTVEAVD
jgi:hypothetical protein